MKVAVVALPWSQLSRPSAAVAALTTYLRTHEPGWDVRAFYEYIRISELVGVELYELIAEWAHSIGEAFFIPCVHTEQRERAVEKLVVEAKGFVRRFVEQCGQAPWVPAPDDEPAIRAMVVTLLERLEHAIETTAERTQDCDVVGLTTCFGQLWANLAYAKAVKRLNPNIVVVLGGSTVSSAVGPSLLKQYPFVDFVVQGEGELPFLALTRALANGDRAAATATKGVVAPSTADALSRGAEMWEVPDMNELPIPSYDDFVDELARLGIPLDWAVPFEGSRGCWWDRINRTGDPRDTCYFCNLNLQWKGYREKSIARVAEEMHALTERYANNRIFCLDNILRHKGVSELASALAQRGGNYEIFHELRANVTPREWVELKRIGLHSAQVGIEGLSTSYLKRIGKGTTAIQNLQAMRYVRELDIAHFGNLIFDFPGATQEEVDETLRVLLDFAVCYDPLNTAPFTLSRDATVFRLKEEFPIENVRNRQLFADLLPEDANRQLALFDLSFDFKGKNVDWSPVRAFCNRFLRDRPTMILRKPNLSYRVGTSFVRIYERRGQFAEIYRSLGHHDAYVAQLPWTMTHVIRDDLARLYTFCMRIRTTAELEAAFPTLGAAAIERALADWADKRLVFREGKKVLALAVAEDIRVAEERVFAQERDAEREGAKTAKRGRPLPLLG